MHAAYGIILPTSQNVVGTTIYILWYFPFAMLCTYMMYIYIAVLETADDFQWQCHHYRHTSGQGQQMNKWLYLYTMLSEND